MVLNGRAAHKNTFATCAQLPIDPMTGNKDWGLRSAQDDPDTTSWGGQDVFDVHSQSTGTALDGTKYSDWWSKYVVPTSKSGTKSGPEWPFRLVKGPVGKLIDCVAEDAVSCKPFSPLTGKFTGISGTEVPLLGSNASRVGGLASLTLRLEQGFLTHHQGKRLGVPDPR